MVLARPLLASFLQAALAAIVIYAATRLIDVPASRRGELVITASALAGVLAAGILYGVLIAIAVSVAELHELARDGTVFAMARVKQDLLVRLKAFGLAAKIGQDRLFPTLPTAVAAYQRWAAEQGQRPGEEPGESRESA